MIVTNPLIFHTLYIYKYIYMKYNRIRDNHQKALIIIQIKLNFILKYMYFVLDTD